MKLLERIRFSGNIQFLTVDKKKVELKIKYEEKKSGKIICYNIKINQFFCN
jgi:hypothetical protein